MSNDRSYRIADKTATLCSYFANYYFLPLHASKLDSEDVIQNYGNLTERKKENYKAIVDQREKINQMCEKLKQNFGKKTVDSIGVLADKDRYDKNLFKSERDAKTEEFVIENANDIDPCDFKKKYTENGIHLFDLNIRDGVTDKSKNATLKFKVRRNSDMDGEKFAEISEYLQKSKGIEIKTSTKEKVVFKNEMANFPNNMKWNEAKAKQPGKTQNITPLKSRNSRKNGDMKTNSQNEIKYKNLTLNTKNQKEVSTTTKETNSSLARTLQNKKK